MAVIEYQPDGMGGWYVYHDTGVVEHVDASGNRVDSSYEGATAIPQGSPAPEGYAVLTDADGVPYLDENGNYLSAEAPEDAETFHVESAGHPAYDQQLYPAFTPTAPAAPAPAAGTGNPYEPGASGSYGYGRSSYSRGGYGYSGSAGGGYGYSGGAGYSSGGGATVPRYGDGSTHPFFGGAPRVPGGRFATESSGGGTYVPDLPYSPARSPGSYGAGGSSGGGGGGGSALYRAWRDKLTSKFYPGSGAGYQSYGGNSRQPKPETPPEPRMRGYARGMDPDQAGAVFTRPSMMIPRVAPGLSGASPLYQDLAAAPAYQFGLLDNSTRRAHERSSLSRTINSIGGFYDRAITKGDYPTFDELTNAFTRTKKNSALGQMMRPEPYGGERYVAGYSATGKPRYRQGDEYYYEPPLAAATSTASSLLGAINSTLDPRAAAAYTSYGNELLDRYGARMLNKKPGHGPLPTRWIGRRLYR